MEDEDEGASTKLSPESDKPPPQRPSNVPSLNLNLSMSTPNSRPGAAAAAPPGAVGVGDETPAEVKQAAAKALLDAAKGSSRANQEERLEDSEDSSASGSDSESMSEQGDELGEEAPHHHHHHHHHHGHHHSHHRPHKTLDDNTSQQTSPSGPAMAGKLINSLSFDEIKQAGSSHGNSGNGSPMVPNVRPKFGEIATSRDGGSSRVSFDVDRSSKSDRRWSIGSHKSGASIASPVARDVARERESRERDAGRAAKQSSGGASKLPSCSTVMLVIFLLWMAVSFWELYSLLTPQACVHASRCMHPLLNPTEALDIYAYASLSQVFPSGPPHKTHKVPIWNVSGVVPAKGQLLSLRVAVPVPKAVRNNGTLYAHFVIVRHGMDPDPGHHPRVSADFRSSTKTGVWPYEDLVMATSPLTRHMKPISRNSSMLLAGEGVGAGAEETGWLAWLEGKNAGQVVCGMALCFALLGVQPPSKVIATVRGGVAVVAAIVCVLALYHAREVSLLKKASRLAADALAGDASTAAVTHWKPRMRLRFVTDSNLYPDHQIPMSHIGWHEGAKNMQPRHYSVHTSGSSVRYAPEVYVDDFALQMKHLVPLSPNTSMPDPTVEIQFHPTGLLSFQVRRLLEDSFRTLDGFGLGERDVDDVKDIVSDVSLKMLCLTYLITILHVIFDYLAFKNDVGFFRGRQSYEGLSSRSLLTNFVCSCIIFLFLLDNDYTSRVILASQFVSVIIEGWKTAKVSKAKMYWKYYQPWVSTAHSRGGTNGSGGMTAGEKLTDEIDAVGLKWLARILYPMVGVWAVYSLVTNPHKSWWSWLISSLANGVYTFGFIAMTPQLFVNYKLKSVAHLPWKPFMYKAFNTFIDDVFSWVSAQYINTLCTPILRVFTDSLCALTF